MMCNSVNRSIATGCGEEVIAKKQKWTPSQSYSLTLIAPAPPPIPSFRAGAVILVHPPLPSMVGQSASDRVSSSCSQAALEEHCPSARLYPHTAPNTIVSCSWLIPRLYMLKYLCYQACHKQKITSSLKITNLCKGNFILKGTATNQTRQESRATNKASMATNKASMALKLTNPQLNAGEPFSYLKRGCIFQLQSNTYDIKLQKQFPQLPCSRISPSQENISAGCQRWWIMPCFKLVSQTECTTFSV